MSLDGYHSVLVLGGIRSGKSEYAESLAAGAPEVRYVATGPAPDPARDADWARRVTAHRQRRPESWTTDETGTDPGRLAALLHEAKPAETVLVDDLGGWLTAVLDHGFWSADAVAEPLAALVAAVRDTAARVILVSPEVGLTVVPETAAGRVFADAMGTANRELAAGLDAVTLVVAGVPVHVKLAGGAPGYRPGQAEVAAAPEEVRGADEPIEPGMTLPLPDEAAAVAAGERLLELDLPGTGLGSLRQVVRFVAGVQRTERPQPFRTVRVLSVYGSHQGAAATGDALGWDRRLADLREGGGALGMLAARLDATVQAVDVAAAGLGEAEPIEEGDAMPGDAVDAALRYGWGLVDAAVDEGVDLLVLAAGGPGQDSVAAALISSATGREAPSLLGRVLAPGGLIDDNAWMVRCAAIRDAQRRVGGGTTRDAKTLLTALGGPDFAVATGILLGAAARQTPIVLDGPVGVAAALVGRELAGQVRLWSLVLDESQHPAVRAGVSVLSLEPMVKLDLGLGEGANALALLPLVQGALALSTLDTVAPVPPA
jgi:adenosyl cobinamide kinase/adenosyl cobinamide phosphate guanylyltransferase/NaMN:DMB phosphoribosyltransferase